LLRIKALTDTIASIARMVEMRDPFTAGHQQRVSELAVAIATELQLGAHEIEGIRLGSLIHDIGKITIPVEVLNKPDRLTEAEFQVIKTHPGVGSEIVANIEFEWPIMEIINQHHERLDGSGYPHGLKQEEICLEARIVGVADIVEAMTAHRHHRQGQNIEQALEQIQSQSGTGLDSAAVNACLRVFREHKFQWSS
jgi:putative nucleotidyltransferase with HDIG domain